MVTIFIFEGMTVKTRHISARSFVYLLTSDNGHNPKALLELSAALVGDIRPFLEYFEPVNATIKKRNPLI